MPVHEGLQRRVKAAPPKIKDASYPDDRPCSRCPSWVYKSKDFCEGCFWGGQKGYRRYEASERTLQGERGRERYQNYLHYGGSSNYAPRKAELRRERMEVALGAAPWRADPEADEEHIVFWVTM